ncbi:MAG TPA: hypothetical protein VIK61_12400 [Acidimicrobiia bacterium]
MAQMIPEIPEGISPAADRAALALAFGFYQADAAILAGRSERTIRRWLQHPIFQELVAQYSASTLYELGARITSYQLQAVDKIAELMNARNEHVQLGAARTMALDLGPKSREELMFARRLAALEQNAAASELNTKTTNKGDKKP